jgi:methylenetetrahydrofolate--tRNA-(uracil-5-)-methyltransferase
MTRARRVVVVGGGLAGCEAAWQASRLGVPVTLYEMRPGKTTEAHQTSMLAELVCSNSFKSDSISNANGLLKLELRMLGSLLMESAARSRVPAGNALCVNRSLFASGITRAIESDSAITLRREEKAELDDDAVTVLAPGPLASPAAAGLLERIVGSPNLYFYDAVSPIVEADSIDMSVAYRLSRYGKGEGTYLNLSLSRGQYTEFVEDLRRAERVASHPFEKRRFFSACMPIEESAGMGDDTLAHGCMKPVGLANPRTGELPWAVVQLRPENLEGTLYGMVGFQTRLKYGEQERILRKLPGLERAVFARLGSIHRNTYVKSPQVLSETLRHRGMPEVFLAGQITGAEGYVSAVGTGLLAGLNAARCVLGLEPVVPPPHTLLGGVVRYVSDSRTPDFQPMNPNFGLVPKLGARIRNRQERNLLVSERSVIAMRAWVEDVLDRHRKVATS